MLHVYNDIFQHVNWTRAEQWTTILSIIKVTTYSGILSTIEISYTHFPKLPEENFL